MAEDLSDDAITTSNHTENRYQAMLDVEAVQLENIRLRQAAVSKLNDLSIRVAQMGDDIQRNTTNVAGISMDLQEIIKLMNDINDIQLRNQELANALNVTHSRYNEEIIADLRRQLLEEQNKSKIYVKQNEQLRQEIMNRDTLAPLSVDDSPVEVDASSGSEGPAEATGGSAGATGGLPTVAGDPVRIAGGRGNTYCNQPAAPGCPAGVTNDPGYPCGGRAGVSGAFAGVIRGSGYSCGSRARVSGASAGVTRGPGYPCESRGGVFGGPAGVTRDIGYPCGGRGGAVCGPTGVTRDPGYPCGDRAGGSNGRPAIAVGPATVFGCPGNPGAPVNMFNFLRDPCAVYPGSTRAVSDLAAIIARLGDPYSPARVTGCPSVTNAGPAGGASCSAGVSGNPAGVVGGYTAVSAPSPGVTGNASGTKGAGSRRSAGGHRGHHRGRIGAARRNPYRRRTRVSGGPGRHHGDRTEVTGASRAVIEDLPAIAVDPEISAGSLSAVALDSAEVSSSSSGSSAPPAVAVNPATGAAYHATGAVDHVTGAGYPDTGAEYPATGAAYHTTGAVDPATGTGYPATGAVDHVTGAGYPDTGAEYPATGAAYHTTGAVDPATGTGYPATGAAYPTTGAVDPATVSDRPEHPCGTVFDRPEDSCALYSRPGRVDGPRAPYGRPAEAAPSRAGVVRKVKETSNSTKRSESPQSTVPNAQASEGQVPGDPGDGPGDRGEFGASKAAGGSAGKAITKALRGKVNSDEHELEKEMRDIFNVFVQECGFCFCTSSFPKKKFYLLCQKILRHGIQNMLYGELVYMHREIFMAAEKLHPGCLLDMVLTEEGLNIDDMLKCCNCQSALGCSDSEEMLEEKAWELDDDIEMAKEYLEYFLQ